MSADPARHHTHSFSLGDVLRIAVVVLVAGLALGYLVATYNADTLDGLARIGGSVGLVTAVMLIFECRRRQQLEEIRSLLDERLERRRRWSAYSDAFADLSGTDGETSGDVSRYR